MNAHGAFEGPLFVSIVDNRLQLGKELHHRAYASQLGDLPRDCGMPTIREHSARRGCLGYQCFVLEKDMMMLYRTLAWNDLNELLKYLGLQDEENSYALL